MLTNFLSVWQSRRRAAIVVHDLLDQQFMDRQDMDYGVGPAWSRILPCNMWIILGGATG